MRLLLRSGVIAACVIGALMAYPHIKPLVVGKWWPEVVSYGNRAKPVLHDIGQTVMSRVHKLGQRPEGRARVTVPVANVRSGPSTTASVIDLLYYNARVTLLARHGKWLRVRLDGVQGKEGWIHQSLLEDDPPSQ